MWPTLVLKETPLGKTAQLERQGFLGEVESSLREIGSAGVEL